MYQDSWDDTCLAGIPVKHFHGMFEIAEQLLSTVVIDDGDAESRVDFEVPLARLQPNRVYASPFGDLGGGGGGRGAGPGAAAGAGAGANSNNTSRANPAANNSNNNNSSSANQQQQDGQHYGGGGQAPSFRWQKDRGLFD